MKGLIVSPALFPHPWKHLGSTVGSRLFQPHVTTATESNGRHGGFYKTLINKKKINQGCYKYSYAREKLSEFTNFTGMNTYGF